MKVHGPAAANMWGHVNDASWQKGCPKIQGPNFLKPKQKTKKNHNCLFWHLKLLCGPLHAPKSRGLWELQFPSKGNLGNLGNEVLSSPESCLEQHKSIFLPSSHRYIYLLLLLLSLPKQKCGQDTQVKESRTTTNNNNNTRVFFLKKQINQTKQSLWHAT